MYSSSIEKLIKLFSKFPTVGPRTAARFVFYLINSPKEKIDELMLAIDDLRGKIKICHQCFKSFEPFDPSASFRAGVAQGEINLCLICSDSRRDKAQICIVEKEVDLETIEKTNKFKGFYFILGFSFSHFKKEDQEQLEEKTNLLLERIEKDGVTEIILALNPTHEGQNTALWLKRKFAPLNIKLTQLGIGLPLGGELEYADQDTLASAIDNRK